MPIVDALRKRELAEIHVLQARLALPEDEYRDLMATVCGGVRSAAQLDVAGRQRFISHLRRLQAMRQGGGTSAPGKHIRGALTPPQRRMWALWMRLVDAGLAQHRSIQAIEAFAQRQTGVARLEWLNQAQERLVLESMKRWLERESHAA
jgi:hypothetical protein